MPNNSLMLTQLAGENALVLCLPSCATMDGSLPEPPGSIARGRWAAASACRSAPGIRGLATT